VFEFCFIASPLFNPEQIQIIKSIEVMLGQNDIGYYSARKHSGSHLLTPEEKQQVGRWKPVFKSNVDGLKKADVCIAVMNYVLPKGQSLALVESRKIGYASPLMHEVLRPGLQIPDTGTVWEMGYLSARGIPVIGYIPEQTASLNLMLPFGCDTMARTVDDLEKLIRVSPRLWPAPHEVWQGKHL
jgi:nucleoside 2-deoxyribosyltransferase